MEKTSKLRATDAILPAIIITFVVSFGYYVLKYPADRMVAQYLNANLVITKFNQHMFLIVVASILAIGTAVPLGIILTRRPFLKFSSFVVSIVNLCQTIPSFAVIAFFVGILGIGSRTAIFALWLYALLPILNNTIAGMNSVSKAIIDAARGMGMTQSKILFKVELPLAMPVIMAGIRTAVVIIVATAVIAAYVGGGGLGDLIITGKNINRWQVLLLGAAYSSCIAILLDHILGIVERILTD